MSIKTYLLLIGFLIGSLLTACGSSEDELDAHATEVAAEIFATQTAEAPPPTPTPTPTVPPSPTPTPLPTHTPTLTPTPTDTATPAPTPTITPLPDLSELTLTLQDLSAGFEEFSPEALGLTPAALSQSDLETTSLFGFIGPGQFEVILGVTAFLPTQLDRSTFDQELRLSGALSQVLSSNLGLQGLEILEQKEIPGLDDLGQASTGLTLVFDAEGRAVRLNIVAFRQEILGVSLYTMHFDDEAPAISIEELARKMIAKLE